MTGRGEVGAGEAPEGPGVGASMMPNWMWLERGMSRRTGTSPPPKVKGWLPSTSWPKGATALTSGLGDRRRGRFLLPQADDEWERADPGMGRPPAMRIGMRGCEDIMSLRMLVSEKEKEKEERKRGVGSLRG